MINFYHRFNNINALEKSKSQEKYNIAHTKKKNFFGFSLSLKNFLIRRNDLKRINEENQNKTLPVEDYYFVFFLIGLVTKLIKIDDKANEFEQKSFFMQIFERNYIINNFFSIYESALNDEQGFIYYVNKIKMLYPSNKVIYEDILAILINVAASDGAVNVLEMKMIKQIAEEFYCNQTRLEMIFNKLLSPEAPKDPYLYLGVAPEVSQKDLINEYRRLAKIYHPDNFASDDFICNEYKKIIGLKFNYLNSCFNQIKKEKKFK